MVLGVGFDAQPVKKVAATRIKTDVNEQMMLVLDFMVLFVDGLEVCGKGDDEAIIVGVVDSMCFIPELILNLDDGFFDWAEI